MVELTIFAKKRNSKEGREFTSYLTQLKRKNGETQSMSVKFKNDAPMLEECPLNIEVERSDMNVSKHKYETEDGNEATGYTLWIKKWTEGSQWVDTSLDDFEFNEI